MYCIVLILANTDCCVWVLQHDEARCVRFLVRKASVSKPGYLVKRKKLLLLCEQAASGRTVHPLVCIVCGHCTVFKLIPSDQARASTQSGDVPDDDRWGGPDTGRTTKDSAEMPC